MVAESQNQSILRRSRLPPPNEKAVVKGVEFLGRGIAVLHILPTHRVQPSHLPGAPS